MISASGHPIKLPRPCVRNRRRDPGVQWQPRPHHCLLCHEERRRRAGDERRHQTAVKCTARGHTAGEARDGLEGRMLSQVLLSSEEQWCNKYSRHHVCVIKKAFPVVVLVAKCIQVVVPPFLKWTIVAIFNAHF